MTAGERFWAKVEKTDGCWFWRACTSVYGYGKFSFGGRTYQAHRFAYELLVGSIPEGLTLDHICRVRNCVNPAHLEPVTNRENLLRGEGFAARHAQQTHCVHGHPFDEENTWFHPDGLGRWCRACNRLHKRARRYAQAVKA